MQRSERSPSCQPSGGWQAFLGLSVVRLLVDRREHPFNRQRWSQLLSHSGKSGCPDSTKLFLGGTSTGVRRERAQRGKLLQRRPHLEGPRAAEQSRPTELDSVASSRGFALLAMAVRQAARESGVGLRCDKFRNWRGPPVKIVESDSRFAR
jgi:hypothetical protein